MLHFSHSTIIYYINIKHLKPGYCYKNTIFKKKTKKKKTNYP